MLANRPIASAALASSFRTGGPRIFAIAAASGVYVLSGSSAALKLVHKFAANSGAYSLTGSPATFTFVRRMSAASGAYVLSGSAAALTAVRRVAAASGAYSLTGSPATFTFVRKVAAASGAYVLSGSSAALKLVRKFAAASGAYSLTGSPATFTLVRRVAAASGAYVLSGSAATLTVIHKFAAASGAYILTGGAATFTHVNGLLRVVIKLQADTSNLFVALADCAKLFLERADATRLFAALADGVNLFLEQADATSVIPLKADAAASIGGKIMAFDNPLLVRSAGDDFTLQFLCMAGGQPAAYVAPVATFSVGSSSAPDDAETPILVKTGSDATMSQSGGNWYANIAFHRADTIGKFQPGVYYCELSVTDGGVTLTVATLMLQIRPTITRP